MATAKKTTKKTSVATVGTPSLSRKHVNAVLLSPRVTEKAAISAEEKGVYAFNVGISVNKKEIAHAVQELFGVTPVAVRVVSIPSKVVTSRRSRLVGHTIRGKKAYVTLKKGEKIEFA